MEINMKWLSLVLVLSLVGCSMYRKKEDAFESEEYKDKAIQTQGMMGANDTLSEQSIQKILSTRIALPKKVSLAIVRVEDESNQLGFHVISENLEKQFYDEKLWGQRVQNIIVAPQIMIKKPYSLSSIRQSAGLLRADLVLIIHPLQYGDWKFGMFSREAKATTTLEILLLDTRTATVPFTSLISETKEIDINGDYSNKELVERAKKLSEEKALMQIPLLVKNYIEKL